MFTARGRCETSKENGQLVSKAPNALKAPGKGFERESERESHGVRDRLVHGSPIDWW